MWIVIRPIVMGGLPFELQERLIVDLSEANLAALGPKDLDPIVRALREWSGHPTD